MKAMKSGKYIAFVISHPYVDALACFREPIQLLAEEGWNVDLYTTLSQMHPAPCFYQDNIRLIPIEITRFGVIQMIWKIVTHRPKYRWIFAVPQWSLYYASIASFITGIPGVCISDELVAESESITAEKRKWKERERVAHQKCRFTIALSQDRAEFIRSENRLGDKHPIVIVPNSCPGSAKRLASHYYQDTLNIPYDKKILLHAGSLWWEPSKKLAEQAKSWSGDWVLVFQIRMISQALSGNNYSNLYFSQTVLPYKLLNYAVSSAYIGLALYDSQRINDALMGCASGKISLYMKNALPVIVIRQKCFEWIEKEGCGICVDKIDEMHEAAEKIQKDYELYVSRVKSYYSAMLDFKTNFTQVSVRLALP